MTEDINARRQVAWVAMRERLDRVERYWLHGDPDAPPQPGLLDGLLAPHMTATYADFPDGQPMRGGRALIHFMDDASFMDGLVVDPGKLDPETARQAGIGPDWRVRSAEEIRDDVRELAIILRSPSASPRSEPLTVHQAKLLRQLERVQRGLAVITHVVPSCPPLSKRARRRARGKTLP